MFFEAALHTFNLVASQTRFNQDLFDSDLPAGDENGSMNRYLAFDQRYYWPMTSCRRRSHEHGAVAEVRPPFLRSSDRGVRSTLAGAHEDDGKQHKVVLKRLMQNKLPASVLGRAKTGLDIPTHDWLRGTLRPLLMDTLVREAIDETKLFRRERVEFFIKEHMERAPIWVITSGACSFCSCGSDTGISKPRPCRAWRRRSSQGIYSRLVVVLSFSLPGLIFLGLRRLAANQVSQRFLCSHWRGRVTAL